MEFSYISTLLPEKTLHKSPEQKHPVVPAEFNRTPSIHNQIAE